MSFSRALLASVFAVAAVVGGPAAAEDVKLGVLLAFTGPLEAMTPPIAAGADLAVTHVNEQGGILGGELVAVTGDSTCADATAASNAADRLVNSENVVAIVGAMCSGATIAVANTVSVPTGTVTISPSATAPGVTAVDDNDLLFRTAPSDAYQGEVMARMLLAKGIDEIAVTYVNNDYGKGFADALEAAFSAAGGTVAANVAHEEGKSDYRAELGNLASTLAENLVVLAYAQGSGQTVLRQAVEAGDFLTFIGGDGMISDELFIGTDASMLEGMIGTRPSTPDLPGSGIYADIATAAGLDPTAIFAPQAYDAAFILALAIEQHGSTDKDGLSEAVRAVSSAPGEVILPGEWEKAKALIADGVDINYEGASGSHEFDENGDVPGSIVEMIASGGSFSEVGMIE